MREVLRIDPTLMYRADYMANYPALAAFLEQHPEVAHNPGFFVGERQFREQSNNPRMEAARAMRDSVEFAGVALIVMTIAAGIIFLVRTVVEHWRWQRAMKAQSELNTKLIDRFANNQELLAYLQSPQGRQLTEGPVLPQRAMRIDGCSTQPHLLVAPGRCRARVRRFWNADGGQPSPGGLVARRCDRSFSPSGWWC